MHLKRAGAPSPPQPPRLLSSSGAPAGLHFPPARPVPVPPGICAGIPAGIQPRSHISPLHNNGCPTSRPQPLSAGSQMPVRNSRALPALPPAFPCKQAHRPREIRPVCGGYSADGSVPPPPPPPGAAGSGIPAHHKVRRLLFPRMQMNKARYTPVFFSHP